MSLKNIKTRNSNKLTIAAAFLTVATAFVSCDSVIYDELPPCVPSYNIRLAFDRNMRYNNEVEKVTAANVYAFDQGGKLVGRTAVDLNTLQSNDWVVPIEMTTGEPHRVIVWGGLTKEAPYTLDATRAINSVEDLTCRLNTTTDAEGKTISKTELTDLFHADCNLTFTKEEGTEEQTVYLTKNNNFIRLILRKQNGSSISHTDYDFFVEEDNGVMGPDNKVIRGEKLWYHPVDRNGFETQIPDGNGGLTDVTVPAAVADLHIVRLTPDSEGKIIIKRSSTGEDIINVSLMPLILAAKELAAPDMDEQEYLDREDKFTIHLVLDENENWVKTEIYINDWIVVYQSVKW